MITKIANILKKEKKYRFVELPDSLRNLIVNFGLGTCFALLLGCVTFSKISMSLWIINIFIFMVLLCITLFYYYIFTIGRFYVIEGQCEEIRSLGYIKKYQEYLIESDGKIYSLRIQSSKSSYIRQGDIIRIYLPLENALLEQTEIAKVINMYGFQRVNRIRTLDK